MDIDALLLIVVLLLLYGGLAFVPAYVAKKKGHGAVLFSSWGSSAGCRR